MSVSTSSSSTSDLVPESNGKVLNKIPSLLIAHPATGNKSDGVVQITIFKHPALVFSLLVVLAYNACSYVAMGKRKGGGKKEKKNRQTPNAFYIIVLH